MSLPKIEIRSFMSSSKYRYNLMAVNIENLNVIKSQNIDDEIYVPSEISHLIAKLVFDTSVYGDISRLFKISLPRNVKMVQIIIVENLCEEELIRERISLQSCHFVDYMHRENFLDISFASSSTWVSCGIEEFLTIPIKSLTILGAELIGQSLKRLTPRMLLSTPTEMYWDDVPAPRKIHMERESGYIFSQNHYDFPDDDPMNLLAIDCEMVCTGDMTDLALARVSVVRCARDHDLSTAKGIKEWLAKGAPYELVYDQLVRPRMAIVDYLTKYSGITDQTLENVTVTAEDVHLHLKTIIKSSTVLVGHSIQMDLKTLRLYHPYLIDTSTIYNTTGDVNRKPGLLSLSRDILKQEIRKKKKGCGHDSVEDAHAALKLTVLKLLKDVNFGNKTRTKHFVQPVNTLLGEWKEVGSAGEKAAQTKEKTMEHAEICKINFGVNESEMEQHGDIQRKIDKFTLLSENPSVVKLPELLCATKRSMELVVNVNGRIGRCQEGNTCTSVHQVHTDHEVVLKTVERCGQSGLVISVLSDYGGVTPSSGLDERIARRVCLQDNIQRIVAGVVPQSAVLVILPGQSGCESTGKLFWKIK